MGRIAGVTPEETKDRLIDAAARVFERKGFEGATVALIASEAGVTTGAIYAHYQSKAELLVDALRCHGERATASLFAPGVRVDAATSLLALGSRIGARPKADNALLAEALLGARRDPELARVLAAALLDREAALTALFAKGQDDDVLTDDLSAAVGARFALMLGVGSMLVSELDLPAVDPSEWTSLIRRLVGAFTQETPRMTSIDQDVNSVDAIVMERDPALLDQILHEVDLHSDVLFTWDYERSRAALVKLYEKAKTSQWNATTDLPWDTEVDWDKLSAEAAVQNERFNVLRTAPGSPLASWGDKEWRAASVEMQTAVLSQFLHGEQGALVCTGLITATVPWIDAKYYAATQVMDEARHVEVFGRYIEEKTNGAYPISPQLSALLDSIIADGRWDITYLGMQIMVEGLALAAFGFMHMLTTEPLLKQLLRYVMSDEARHVAFGVLSLKELYEGLDSTEIRERQEFAFEAAVQLRNRFMVQDVWERLGADPKAVVAFMNENRNDPGQEVFQTMLFSKIVPNAKKLGLLDAGDGWLRTKFTELGIIQFEDWVDTSEEYTELDAVAADRA